ncbi:unnamed protein product [Lactuca saligna]|uniref:Uncharacterized protein n=1 Tax=Lactuca saligna TaxID=75948 RepID=A0AA35Z1Y5_LACSI|nr:unnamed protein product [Lactuca saligna]
MPKTFSFGYCTIEDRTCSFVSHIQTFFTTHYEESSATIIFELGNLQTSITNSRYSRLLGLSLARDLIDLESISSSTILEMFYHTGYGNYLAIVSKFNKPNLPPMWNGLFTLIFKSFLEKVMGLDSASKLFLTILYGIYFGINLDYESVLSAQLVQSTIYVTWHSEISCACFWSIIVQRALDRHNIPVIKGSALAKIPIFTLQMLFCLTVQENVEVFDARLFHANKEIEDLKSEKVVIKSWVADVNDHLHNLIKTCDSLLTFSVHQHLAKKLKPIFSILDRIKGVSESSIPKQRGETRKTSGDDKATDGGDDHEQKLKSNDLKNNVASASRGKENLVNDDDEEEEDENEKLKCKTHDDEIDENM